MEPTLAERKEVQKYIRDSVDIGWHVPESQLQSPCWNWRKSCFPTGYGQLRRFGEQRAHRVSFRAFKGEIPKGLWVCHECDNPACVNPDHLWLGTIADDMADMVAKGRQAKGENNPFAKLTEAQIRQIFHRRSEGFTQSQIGKEFGISQVQVCLILQGKSWRSLKK